MDTPELSSTGMHPGGQELPSALMCFVCLCDPQSMPGFGVGNGAAIGVVGMVVVVAGMVVAIVVVIAVVVVGGAWVKG